VLNDLHLTVPQGDLSGQVAVGLAAPRPMLRAELTSNRIDADALRAVPTPRPAAAPQAAPAPGPAPAPAAGTPPPQRVERGPMEQPLPFPLLRLADADVSLKVGELKSRDQTYRNLAGHAVVHDGALTLAPFDVDLPAGHLDGKLTANANASPPTVSATAHAPSLNVQTLLATAGHAGPASGNVEVNAAVSGTGDTPHQLVASLDGPIGIALVNGQIDNRLLGDTLAFVLQKVQLLDVFRRGGNSDLRCFALRIDARHGIGDVSALLLNSSLLTMDGGGSVNFADQTMSLRLRPQARVAGTGVYVPLLVTGSWHNPVVNTDPAGLVTSNAGTAAGIALGFATMGAAPAAGALLGKDLFGSGDACARPVALARLSTPAPEAAAPPPSNAQPQQKPKLPNPADLLRQLFR
jgi:AsmA protein